MGADSSLEGPSYTLSRHCCVGTRMHAMLIALLGTANRFCLPFWILSHKQEHTNIPGAAIDCNSMTENMKLLENLNADNSAFELQDRSCAGRAGPQTPSVTRRMFPGLPGTRTGSLKSPTSMGSVTRTISSFWPYVLSSPIKGLIQKHLLKGGSK